MLITDIVWTPSNGDDVTECTAAGVWPSLDSQLLRTMDGKLVFACRTYGNEEHRYRILPTNGEQDEEGWVVVDYEGEGPDVDVFGLACILAGLEPVTPNGNDG